MKTFFFRACSLLAGSVLLFSSCSKKDDPVVTPTPPPVVPIDSGSVIPPATLQMRFTPTMDGQPLVLATKEYTNAAGETFSVTLHKYFVSNFALWKEGATTPQTLPASYFLIDAADLRTVSIPGIPAGTYTKISFMIGIDSTRNVSGDKEGDLDPSGRAKGMFWDWNAGYIQAKMEGKSPQSDLIDSSLFFHVGGFDGRWNALRTVTLNLPSALVVADGKTPMLQIQSDLGSWFAGSPPIRFKDQGQIMSPGKEAMALADNYAKGYKVVSVTP